MTFFAPSFYPTLMQNVVLATLFAAFFFAFQASAQTPKSTKGEYKVACIGFYNLENLFDTIDSPETNDADFLPNGKLLWNTEKYVSKQANMAKVISQLGTELSPDGLAMLGVAEVENKKVLDDLVSQPALRNRNYQVVLIEGSDERGIDCGLLYQSKYFKMDGARSVPVVLINPQSGERDFTRDILLVSGKLDGQPVHVMVCHWPSRRGGESGSAWARAAAADRCKALADSIRATNEDARVIVMGDLNDDPTNKSLTKHLKAAVDIDKVAYDGFFNTMYEHFKVGNGTLAYNDSWNLFDQICISKSFMNLQAKGEWAYFKSVVYRKPYLIEDEGRFKGYPFRTYSYDVFINGYSDHLPVYVVLVKRE